MKKPNQPTRAEIRDLARKIRRAIKEGRQQLACASKREHLRFTLLAESAEALAKKLESYL
ncbi:MAG: hypothetical protein LBK76_02495 [Verrucomicrobiales bacterium]|nr:hypothetical protein [Verrucomicrobiales bacterium]